MKKINALTGLILFGWLAISSCQKEIIDAEVNKPTVAKSTLEVEVISPEHVFTDIDISQTGTIFLCENQTIKTLSGTTLTDYSIPVAVYNALRPNNFYVANNGVIIFRSENGVLKLNKDGTFTRYDRSALDWEETFPDGDIVYNTDNKTMYLASDNGLYFFTIDANGKIGTAPSAYARSLDFCDHNVLRYGGTPDVQLVNNSGSLRVYNIAEKRFVHIYGATKVNTGQFPEEGKMDEINFHDVYSVAVSNDGKLLLFVTKDGDNYSLKQIKEGYMTTVANHLRNYKIDLSADKSTVYLAGKGLTKITL